MNDQELYDLQPDDPEWIRQRLDSRPGPTRVVLKAIDDDLDVEGHAIGTSLRLRAFDDEDDTEGHAISVHFPSREAAATFRRRLMLTGVLTGTLVVGAAGGIGLANVTNDAAGTGAVTSAGSAAGMDWTQAERPGQAAAGSTGSAAGMDWSQAERPGQAAAAGSVSSGEGMDWVQAERPGQAADADSSDAQAPARGTTPVPE